MATKKQGHLSAEAIEKYLDQKLTDEEMFELDDHLGGCAECAGRVRSMRRFNFAWEQWTAKAHGEAYRQVLALGWQGRLALALMMLSRRREDLRQRLAAWFESTEMKAEAAFELAVDGGKRIAEIASEGVASLIPPKSPWQFRPALTPIRVRGVVRTRGGVPTKDKSQAIIITEGPPGAGVSVDAQEGVVTVWFENLKPGQIPPLVLLVPEAEGVEPLVEVLARQEGETLYRAEFSGVPDGEYLLAIEPME